MNNSKVYFFVTNEHGSIIHADSFGVSVALAKDMPEILTKAILESGAEEDPYVRP